MSQINYISSLFICQKLSISKLANAVIKSHRIFGQLSPKNILLINQVSIMEYLILKYKKLMYIISFQKKISMFLEPS